MQGQEFTLDNEIARRLTTVAMREGGPALVYLKLWLEGCSVSREQLLISLVEVLAPEHWPDRTRSLSRIDKAAVQNLLLVGESLKNPTREQLEEWLVKSPVGRGA